MNEELSYGMRVVLEKMFSYVDANLDETDIKKDGWYSEYEWSEEEEQEFKEWLIDQFMNNRRIRDDVTTMTFTPTRSRAENAANWFILYCGWKTKLEKKDG